jgi:hypothetical protein
MRRVRDNIVGKGHVERLTGFFNTNIIINLYDKLFARRVTRVY